MFCSVSDFFSNNDLNSLHKIKFVVTGLFGNLLDDENFDKHEIITEKENTIPYHAFENHYMAIYCDIIQPQYFGNKIVKVLKVIPFNSNNQAHGISSYIDYPHYVPVLYNTINSITIELYDLHDLHDSQMEFLDLNDFRYSCLEFYDFIDF